MPRSWFDFGNIDSVLAGSQPDISELLQLQNGITLINMLGRTVYYEDFSKGTGGWFLTNTGAGTIPYLAGGGLINRYYLWGNGSNLALQAGAVLNDTSYLFRSVFLNKQITLGLEIGLVLHSQSQNILLECVHEPVDFSEYTMQAKISRANGKINIVTPTGDIDIATFPVPLPGNGYRTQCKLVGDWSTGKYKYLFFNEERYDLQQYSMVVSASTQKGVARQAIIAMSTGAAVAETYIGYIRFSKDEP